MYNNFKVVFQILILHVIELLYTTQYTLRVGA